MRMSAQAVGSAPEAAVVWTLGIPWTLGELDVGGAVCPGRSLCWNLVGQQLVLGKNGAGQAVWSSVHVEAVQEVEHSPGQAPGLTGCG